ncbi:PREDICTED: putative expansin-B2 [Erythranthe guttata]|uniref:putative expansin-B2 n=1 Tax=Erythranthe guttata TaxID=4155 RepID=UPI00064DDBC7|nr:PREDICTED: putative expansin-B2 [Erythranthe guttata]|eukprot:XP_012843347.1 PREDICTED: putative expansin-B2 [Erythranthe guttata]
MCIAGGACGFDNDVAYPPYNGMTAAGNQNIFQSGKGCGACYQVKCTENPLCSGNPVTVTVTNECPGTCNNEAFHFDLSGKAFGALAKPGQADPLRKWGRINIQYQRQENKSIYRNSRFYLKKKLVLCNYNGTNITFKIDSGSNPNYLAFAVEYVNGDGDIGSLEILSDNSKGWLSMKQSWGETWAVGLPVGISGPYSVRLTTIESKKTVLAYKVIPGNWVPGQSYHSRVNVP